MTRTPDIIKKHSFGWIWGWVWQRPRRKKTFFMVCSGQVGAGKSWAMLGLAELLDRGEDGKSRFDVDRICFSASKFTRTLRTDWPKGTVVILDDAAIAAFSRDTMTKANKELIKTLNSIRFKGLIILISVPHFTSLDVGARKLMNRYTEILTIDAEESRSIAKYQMIVTDRFGNYFGRKNISKPKVVKTITGMSVTKTIQYPLIKYDKPSQHLIDKYEKNKRDFMNARLEESEKELLRLEKPEIRRRGNLFPVRAVSDDMIQRIDDFWDEKKGKPDMVKIRLYQNKKLGIIEISKDNATFLGQILSQNHSEMQKGILNV